MPAKPPRRGKPRASYSPGEFLDLPPEAAEYSRAAAVILPLPYEDSVSYGGGAAMGPEAIVDASRQVELYDALTDAEPAPDIGVHTLSPPGIFFETPKPGAEAVIDAIAGESFGHSQAGKFVVGLGGEHTVSLGLVKGIARARGALVLVQIDAHADLRDVYGNNPYSHACVVRRIADLPECEGVIQLGIRSTSRDQVDFSRERRPKNKVKPFVKTHYAEEMHRDDAWKKDLAKRIRGKKAYFTFDVDGLDPAFMPATGTPEPDGLTWRQLMAATDIVADNAIMTVGMDCVELAPLAGLHHADFTAAKAVYRLLSRFVRSN
ncbi:MAG: agmatinase [Planctomycetota bacterium]|jgi:agmatinase|nr:agmatinase [Planctomycetota bacterium]